MDERHEPPALKTTPWRAGFGRTSRTAAAVGGRTGGARPGLKRLTMKRTFWLLFCCQALMSSVTVVQVSTGALIGHSLATHKALATLPAAVHMAAAMAASALAVPLRRPLAGRLRPLLPRRGA